MNSNLEPTFFPTKQEIIWVNFQPSTANELRGRHPAVVLSTSGFSKVTGQVAVSPITHGRSNRLNDAFIPVTGNEKIDGYVNPFQFHTFSISGRHIESSGTFLSTEAFAQLIQIHKQILDI